MSASTADRAITSHPTAPFTCLSGTGVIERGTVPGTASLRRVGETAQLDSLSKPLAGKAEGDALLWFAYGPSGGLGLIVVILLVLLLMGRL
jgi:hypothetical protein